MIGTIDAQSAHGFTQPLDSDASPGAVNAAHWELGLPELVTHDVILREPRLADAGSLLTVLQDPEVSRFISPPPPSVQGIEQFITWSQHERYARRHFCYAIVPRGQSEAVGLIQVRRLDPAWQTAEWGFALARRFWGTGVFTTSATLAVDFAFRGPSVHRLEARALVGNGRGNGVLGKLGARAEGVLHGSFVVNGRGRDQILWTILAEDWWNDHAEPTYLCRAPLTREPERDRPTGSGAPASVPAWRHVVPSLCTSRVTVRELRSSDAETLAGLLSAPAVSKWIDAPPRSADGFERFVRWSHRERETGQGICFGVVPAGGEAAVGLFQIRQLDGAFRIAEWGFALGERYWGSGTFEESARLVLHFAFDVIGVHRLEARAAVANSRGSGALRKLGAIREGALRRSFLLGRQYFDDALWAILAEHRHS